MERKAMVDGVKIEKQIDFNSALDLLHSELHNIDLYGFQK
jgi:hypothetical protein